MERVALAHSRALNRRPNYFSLSFSLRYRYLPIDRSGRFLLAVSSVWGPSSWGPRLRLRLRRRRRRREWREIDPRAREALRVKQNVDDITRRSAYAKVCRPLDWTLKSQK